MDNFILYSELPEYLYKEMRVLDHVRREFTVIVKIASEHGFNQHRRNDANFLSGFIEQKLIDLAFVADLSGISLDELFNVVQSASGIRPKDPQETVDIAVHLIQRLQLIVDTFGNDVLSLMEEIVDITKDEDNA